ncbi:MAG: hypothetical protein U9Q66_04610 [Patescibacteria group bacterium]|nr:hypothetical protein [Patescibacteria group bacterium]
MRENFLLEKNDILSDTQNSLDELLVDTELYKKMKSIVSERKESYELNCFVLQSQ